ncbi:MAG: recO [Gammaproteobacteria bacterium]|jgi:DNA repair protein RecO (recombination protein O)|nr:recO [Gammaproteobacteria bacterium]
MINYYRGWDLNKITLQPAFILHRRAYRETSLLLDLFTESYGRISLIARGVRGHRSRLRSLLQPFVPLLISWQGKSELMLLNAAENNGAPFQLRGDCLLSGFYLNELLMRVLPKQDPHPPLYTIYHDTLLELQSGMLQQHTLRLFEKKLLAELGYGLQLQYDFSTGEKVVAEQFYLFYPEQGFKRSASYAGEKMQFKGKSLLALAEEEFPDEECRRDAKRLMRIALASLLGLSFLHSRKLFTEVQ